MFAQQECIRMESSMLEMARNVRRMNCAVWSCVVGEVSVSVSVCDVRRQDPSRRNAQEDVAIELQTFWKLFVKERTIPIDNRTTDLSLVSCCCWEVGGSRCQGWGEGRVSWHGSMIIVSPPASRRRGQLSFRTPRQSSWFLFWSESLGIPPP
jgi:hypothetical protein